MRKLFILLACSLGIAYADCTYSAQFPSSVATATNLYVAGDNLTTTLASSMNGSDGVAVVTSSTGWAVNMIATVESEKLLVTGVLTNVLQVTRGFRGTTAASHTKNKTVANYVNCDYHESMKSELMGVEGALGANLVNVFNRNVTPLWNDTTSSTGYTAQFGATTPLALFRAMQNCPTCTANDGVSGVVTVPQSATNAEAAGVYGGVSNQSTTTNAVAGRFYARSIANGIDDAHRVKVWGINTLMEDQTYGTGSIPPYNATAFAYAELINEFDFNIASASTKVLGMSLGGNSTIQPSSALGFICNSLGSAKWDACLIALDGTATVGMQLGTLATGNNTASQPIYLYGRDAGAVAHLASIQNDADGNLNLSSNTSISFNVNGVVGALADSNGLVIEPNKRVFLWGGAHIETSGSQTDLVGQIAISAATSGAKTFARAYTAAPSCTVTPTSTPGATLYWVTTSTTAVTVNLSGAASLTFNYHCMGNPN